MAAVPLDIEASVMGADPARPDEVTHRPRPGRGGLDAGSGAGRPPAPEDRRPAPRRSRRSATPTGSSSGPGPGSPGAAAPAGPELARGAGRQPGSPAGDAQPRRQTGRRTASRAENHLEVLTAHAPELVLDVVLADPSIVDDERVLRDVAAGARRRAGRGTGRRARPAGAPRPAASRRGVPRHPGLSPRHRGRRSGRCRWRDGHRLAGCGPVAG